MIRYTTETATIYSQRAQVSKKRTAAQILAQENLIRDNNYNGFLSKKTAREVTKRISNLLEIAKAGGRTVTFTTLTLPSIQVHSDEFIRRYLLGDFLRLIKQKYSVVNYIWKAEAQNNGNIHFHILADAYLPNTVSEFIPDTDVYLETGEINKLWNAILDRYGYIDNYRFLMFKNYNEGKIKAEKLAFQVYNMWSQPNSTDVHALKSKTKPEAYINKYIAKPEPNKRKITGRLVGCSDTLKECFNYVDSYGENKECITALNDMVRQNPKECLRIAITDSGIRKNFTETSNEKILLVKYYYTSDLWNKYAPDQHKQYRMQYFENIADMHYLGVLNE